MELSIDPLVGKYMFDDSMSLAVYINLMSGSCTDTCNRV